MPALTNLVREELTALLNTEIQLVRTKAVEQGIKIWERAEKALAEEQGLGDTLAKIEHIKNQIVGLQQELTELESSMHHHHQIATQQDYEVVGLKVFGDRYGKVSDWNRPQVCGKEIRTKWDCLIFEYISRSIPFLQIERNLSQLQHTMRRELLLCGNYEEARALYTRFHSKIHEAIGTDVPGLLSEVQAIPELAAPDLDNYDFS